MPPYPLRHDIGPGRHSRGMTEPQGDAKAERPISRFIERGRRRLRSWRVRAQLRLGRRKQRREMRERLREHDDRDNAEVALPDGEKIYWPAFWMAELYGPSHIPKLIEALERLGLDTRPDVGNYVLELLRQGRIGYGGWSRAGDYRPASGQEYLGARKSDLPEDFKLAQPFLHGISDGITVSITAFFLADEASTCLDELMRKEFVSEVRPIKGGDQHITADWAKEEAIGAKRMQFRRNAETWVSRHFPGAFAQGLDEQFPVWDCVVTEKEPILTDGRGRSGWRQPLGYSFVPERWTTSELPGLTLCDPRSGRRRDEATRTLTGLRQDFVALDETGGAPRDVEGALHMIQLSLNHLFAYWTLHLALSAQQRRFGEVRDALNKRRPFWSAGLKDLEKTVLPRSLDLQALVKATTNKTTRSMLERDAPAFRDVDVFAQMSNRKPKRTKFFKALSKWLSDQAETAQDEAGAVVSATRAMADVVVARTNIRLQVAVLILSVAVIALTAVQIVIALNGD